MAVKYRRVKVLSGANKGAHIDIPVEKFDKAPEGTYEALPQFEDSNFQRRTKFPVDLKADRAEKKDLSVTVAETRAADVGPDTKVAEGDKKEG